MLSGEQQQFLGALKAAMGVVAYACDALKIDRDLPEQKWILDPEFADEFRKIKETQIDFVEFSLLKAIKEGNVTAMIFYLKTKGRHRGYVEKDPPPRPVTPPQQLTLPEGGKVKRGKTEIEKKVENKKRYIVKTLEKQGKYTAELSMQVTIAAQLLVKVEVMAGKVLDAKAETSIVETYRNGAEHTVASVDEKLFLQYIEQAQRALKALGMNTDSKERRTDSDDGFAEFMSEFRNDPGDE